MTHESELIDRLIGLQKEWNQKAKSLKPGEKLEQLYRIDNEIAETCRLLQELYGY